MRKALVTGGAGFLGSHLVDALLARGVDVVAIDNLFRGNMTNLKAATTSSRFSFVNGNILDIGALETAVRGCDIIFHLAAINGTKYFYEIPKTILRVNIMGTENVLNVAEKARVRRVVFTSTSEVYGCTTTIPTPEDSESVFTPPDSVRWCYAISKLVDEHMCLTFARETKLETRILRVFNAYGPRLVSSDYGQVVGVFAEQLLNGEPPVIYGDGQQTRAFTYVSDIVEGIIKAAEMEGGASDIFNLGSEREITINKLADTMAQVAGVERGLKLIYVDAIPDEPRRRCPLIEKAKTALSYQPKVDLASGLKQTIDWFRSQPES